MIELKPTELFAIAVDLNTTEFKISGTNYLAEKYQENWFVLGEVPLIGNFKILGTATKDEIDFDVEPFVGANIVWNGVKNVFIYKDYENDYGNFLDNKQSFYSLLKANECYFENPHGQEPKTDNCLILNDWHNANLGVNDKYLIIQKL